MEKFICKYCGKEFEKSSQLGGHIIRCKGNPNYEINLKKCNNLNKKEKEYWKDKICYCSYCNKLLHSENSLKQHEIRCNKNPNKIKSGFELYNDNGHKGYNQYTKAKKLGLDKPIMSKETKEKISKIWKGKHLPDEVKQKISESQKKYYLEHPDKIPYKLWHSSEISYPEQYFKDVFEKENINLEYHLQIGLYELDFYNEDTKKYVEIDGGTHYKKNVQEIDKRKDNYLNSLGWQGFRVKWDEYKKLSYEEKHKIVENIRSFISK